MKRLFLSYCIISFASIAVFGFAAMGSEGGHSGCIAAVSQGMDCPASLNPIAFASFHLSAFNRFVTAIFGEPILAALLLAVLVFFVIVRFFRLARFAALPAPGFFVRVHPNKSFVSPSYIRLAQWLALHEHSPSIL